MSGAITESLRAGAETGRVVVLRPPMGRLGRLLKPVRLAVFLASDPSGFVTGAVGEAVSGSVTTEVSR